MAKGRKRILANSVVTLATLLAYYATTLSPQKHLWAGFWALSVPLMLLTQILFAAHWFLQKSWWIVLPLCTLVLGYPHFKSSINFSFKSPKNHTENTFSVFSYNVKVFNAYNHLQGKDSINAKRLIQQVVEDSSDIKCLQEFFCEDSSKVFNTINRIKQEGKYKYIISPNLKKRHNYFGMAIFSKYPILKSGEIKFKKSYNRAHFADIKVKNKTVRVYNIHLQSISLDEDKMTNGNNYEELKKNYNNIFRRMQRGFLKRTQQVDLVIQHIKKSPYPVIVCGDFNDT
ncbi:MAG: endonuclease/exonuclease/phosphatase family protein, partial [Thermonemataceae bacterium]|nr:endonuclease/exonuclease/phosphatase family protein [Thermonemataceae bacterium]